MVLGAWWQLKARFKRQRDCQMLETTLTDVVPPHLHLHTFPIDENVCYSGRRSEGEEYFLYKSATEKLTNVWRRIPTLTVKFVLGTLTGTS